MRRLLTKWAMCSCLVVVVEVVVVVRLLIYEAPVRVVACFGIGVVFSREASRRLYFVCVPVVWRLSAGGSGYLWAWWCGRLGEELGGGCVVGCGCGVGGERVREFGRVVRGPEAR